MLLKSSLLDLKGLCWTESVKNPRVHQLVLEASKVKMNRVKVSIQL